MSESEVDTSRTVVQTYVPAYQREAWDNHAEELGMSRSEFVKSMVQAGRRVFEDEGAVRDGTDTGTDPSNGASPPVEEGPPLEERIRTTLRESGPLSWEELFAAVSNDIEERLDETLTRLQAANEVRHSGREGGYVLEAGGPE